MVNVLELKAQITRKGFKQKDVCDHLGLSKQQWVNRMKKRKLDSDEIYELVKFLCIDDPAPIFFADDVTQK